MGNFDVVLIGGSLGGIEALGVILGALPANFPAAIAVVLHRSPHGPGILAEIIGRRTRLSVKDAAEGDHLVPGTVHIAPPDRHLLIDRGGSLSLSNAAKVRFSRPSVDRLFESGAESLGGRIIAVVLTGYDGDGADGVRAVKRWGGMVLTQNRETAEVSDMPLASIATGTVDLVLPLEAIAGTLLSLVRAN
ncbi:chemotaxis protein CheB [Singulisphaera rosea]